MEQRACSAFEAHTQLCCAGYLWQDLHQSAHASRTSKQAGLHHHHHHLYYAHPTTTTTHRAPRTTPTTTCAALLFILLLLLSSHSSLPLDSNQTLHCTAHTYTTLCTLAVALSTSHSFE